MAELCLTIRTVEHYRSRACKKLGVRTAAAVGRVWFAGVLYEERKRIKYNKSIQG